VWGYFPFDGDKDEYQASGADPALRRLPTAWRSRGSAAPRIGAPCSSQADETPPIVEASKTEASNR